MNNKCYRIAKYLLSIHMLGLIDKCQGMRNKLKVAFKTAMKSSTDAPCKIGHVDQGIDIVATFATLDASNSIRYSLR